MGGAGAEYTEQAHILLRGKASGTKVFNMRLPYKIDIYSCYLCYLRLKSDIVSLDGNGILTENRCGGTRLALQLIMNTNDEVADRMYNIPAQLTPFVGRTEELSEIDRLLTNPVCKLLTLVGPGGIGKTRLAIEAAQAQFERYADGVYFVAMQPVSSPEYIVSAVADAVWFQTHQAGDPRQQLLNNLSEKKLLLVLDNFEHLLEGVSIVTDILERAPGVKILVTSREALNLTEEWQWQVSGMRYPRNGHQDGRRLEDYSAVKLFVQHARRVRPDFSLEAEQDGVRRICALVEGMPLALELAATWVRTLSCDEIAQEIEQSLDILKTRARNVPERHRNMRVVMEYSWQLLAEEDRQAFARLSAFRGSFTREAAETVACTSLVTLAALVDQSLVRRNAAGRYTLHDLIRQYGEEQLLTSREMYEHTRDLHCAYYAAWLYALWDDMVGANVKEALAAVEDEIGNVRAAWRWAGDHKDEDSLLKALDSLWFFYDTRSYYKEGEKAFDKVIEALVADDPAQRSSQLVGKLLARRASLLSSLGRFDEAYALFEEATTIARRHESPEDIAFVLTRMGELYSFKDKHGEAAPFFEESLAIYRELGDRWREAFVLNWLGSAKFFSENDPYVSGEYYWQGFDIYQELDSQWGIAIMLPTIAHDVFEHGDHEQAMQLAHQGVALCKEIGIQWGVAMALGTLGYVHYHLGEYHKAKQYLLQSLRISMDVQLNTYIRNRCYDLEHTLRALGDDMRADVFNAIAAHYSNAIRCGTPPLYSIQSKHALGESKPVQQVKPIVDPEAELKALVAELAREGDDEGDEAALSINALAEPLTEREHEILQLVAAGLSNREIAAELVLALGTVKWYINQIFSKMHVSSRTQAVARARECALIE
jgi:predicted ATPase/DNA-binding NarL/FixJ family response regulator